MGFAGRGQNQGHGVRQAQGLGPAATPGPAREGRGRQGDARRSGIRGAIIFAFPPPAVTELGIATGFDIMLQDRGDLGHEALSGRATSCSAWRRRTRGSRACGRTACPTCRSTRSTSTGRRPARSACRSAPSRATSRRPSAAPTSATSSRAAASSASTRRPTRRSGCCPSDLDRLYVRNRRGEHRPALGRRLGPLGLRLAAARALQRLPRDEHPGRAGAGPQLRRGDAGDGGADRRSCPAGVGHEWTGLSYQQRMSESQAGLLYAFSVLVIFLVLAALYESWTVPISIVLALPLGVIGGVIASSLAGHGERRLLPDRPADRARADDQERDPDRAVRRAATWSRGWGWSRRRWRPRRRGCARSS